MCEISSTQYMFIDTCKYFRERAQNSIFYIVGKEQCDQYGIKN